MRGEKRGDASTEPLAEYLAHELSECNTCGHIELAHNDLIIVDRTRVLYSISPLYLDVIKQLMVRSIAACIVVREYIQPM